ncbi:MAG: hypothetical protein NW215_09005 [Hyphomicrobiales bacterium]|nr:hypothetical protein [Hyphomicrobiales bacterium]
MSKSSDNAQAERRKRRAEELRANLKRRKEQARKRDAGADHDAADQ